MKNWGMLALLAGSMAIAAPAVAQDEILTVVNRTGYTISELYISHTGSADWEEDLLGSDILANGARTRIDFTNSEETCWWDILVVYDDGEQVAWDELDFCSISQVDLYYNANSGETTAQVQ